MPFYLWFFALSFFFGGAVLCVSSSMVCVSLHGPDIVSDVRLCDNYNIHTHRAHIHTHKFISSRSSLCVRHEAWYSTQDGTKRG